MGNRRKNNNNKAHSKANQKTNQNNRNQKTKSIKEQIIEVGTEIFKMKKYSHILENMAQLDKDEFTKLMFTSEDSTQYISMFYDAIGTEYSLTDNEVLAITKELKVILNNHVNDIMEVYQTLYNHIHAGDTNDVLYDIICEVYNIITNRYPDLDETPALCASVIVMVAEAMDRLLILVDDSICSTTIENVAASTSNKHDDEATKESVTEHVEETKVSQTTPEQEKVWDDHIVRKELQDRIIKELSTSMLTTDSINLVKMLNGISRRLNIDIDVSSIEDDLSSVIESEVGDKVSRLHNPNRYQDDAAYNRLISTITNSCIVEFICRKLGIDRCGVLGNMIRTQIQYNTSVDVAASTSIDHEKIKAMKANMVNTTCASDDSCDDDDENEDVVDEYDDEDVVNDYDDEYDDEDVVNEYDDEDVVNEYDDEDKPYLNGEVKEILNQIVNKGVLPNYTSSSDMIKGLDKMYANTTSHNTDKHQYGIPIHIITF